MTDVDRVIPPFNVDERTTVESWLDFQRATLASKCRGLDDEQAATRTVPPSGFSLTGLVQHMAEVERNWFRRVLAGENAPPMHQANPDGTDGGFDVSPGTALAEAMGVWHAEIDHARRNCATRELSDTGRLGDQDVSLRWIYVHMIEEYARHNGHADLVRECLDGATGH